MRVKVYDGGEPRERCSRRAGMHPSDAFLASAIQSAARSGRFSVEAGGLGTSSGKTNSPSKNSKMCELHVNKMLEKMDKLTRMRMDLLVNY